jgi:hypothetical protein
MRRAAVVIIFGFGLLMVLWVCFVHSFWIVQRLVVVDVVEGKVEVLVHGRGDPVPLEVGELVRAGDVIRTGSGSLVELRWVRWAGGMRIKIGENTHFRVIRSITNRKTKETNARLGLDLGKIWVRVREALTGKSKFEVETPTVVAAVRGTVFSVAVAEDGTSQVEVLEGEVAVARRDGPGTILTGGSHSHFSPGQQAVETRPLAGDEMEAWMRQASLLGPFLAVNSPADGAVVTEPSCGVSGRAEPGAEVFVNGRAIEPSREAEFLTSVPLEPGPNTVAVTVRDSAGRETTLVRTVSRKTPD